MLLSPLDVMMRLVLYIAIFVKYNNLIAFVIAYSSFKESYNLALQLSSIVSL